MRVVGAEAHELLPGTALRHAREGRAADELLLLQLHHPRHVRLNRRRERVGVLGHDQVLLLQPQHALRLHPERPDAESRPGFHQRVPHVLAVLGRIVDLVAQLPDEADAKQERRHVRHHPLPRREITERAR